MTDAPNLDGALLAFHAAAGELDLAKNRAGHTNEYLDLDKAMGQIRPLLATHGLYVRHYTGWEEGVGWFAGTIVEHAPSRESHDSGKFPLRPSKEDAQGFGSALTYARRYTLMEVLALVADNDADGAGAGKPARRQRAASGKITSAQRTEMMAHARTAGVPTDRLKEIVKDIAGVESSAEIPAEKFADVVKAIEAENS